MSSIFRAARACDMDDLNMSTPRDLKLHSGASSHSTLMSHSSLPHPTVMSLGRASVASDASSQSVRKKVQLAKIEDLEIALDTALKVNRHLNYEVEKLVREVDRIEREKEAWKKHAMGLARQLADARKADSGDSLEREAEALAQLPQQQYAPQPAFNWPSTHPLLQEVLARGQSAGWLVHHREVQLQHVLGEGAFGKTFKGTWRGGEVAVKCVRVDSERTLVNFLREIESLAALRHPNILPFFAACLESATHCWLLTEFLPGGNLSTWLYGSNPALPPTRSIVERLTVALEVARGMCALEACPTPILHRDLKPSNVLLDAHGHARLADFGLARRLLPGAAATLTGETGTYVYMSPEMIRHDVYDIKTDVWSWGVLLVELVQQRLPYETLYMTPVQVALAVADEQLAPPVPEDIDPGLQTLVYACCHPDPDMRPSFATIVEEMTRVLPDIRAEYEAQHGGVLGRFLRKGQLPSSWSNVLGRVSNAIV